MEGTRRTNEQWLADLRDEGPAGEAAQRDLHRMVAGAVRKALATQGSLDDARLDDLAQVATLQVLAKLDRFEGRSRFTTWAYAVAVRAALGELRKSSYRDGGEPLSEAADVAAETEPPTASLERGEIVETMHRIIEEQLTEKQRAAILGELAETPQDELIAQLGTNRNALYKLVHDARQKLKVGLRAAGICDDEVRRAFDL